MIAIGPDGSLFFADTRARPTGSGESCRTATSTPTPGAYGLAGGSSTVRARHRDRTERGKRHGHRSRRHDVRHQSAEQGGNGPTLRDHLAQRAVDTLQLRRRFPPPGTVALLPTVPSMRPATRAIGGRVKRAATESTARDPDGTLSILAGSPTIQRRRRWNPRRHGQPGKRAAPWRWTLAVTTTSATGRVTAQASYIA